MDAMQDDVRRVLFHITSRTEANEARAKGTYAPSGFEAEGFIHCSNLEQVVHVANRRFFETPDLVLFEIESRRLDCPVVDENLEGGEELFPHIYGRLPMSVVVGVHDFPHQAGGSFRLPVTLSP